MPRWHFVCVCVVSVPLLEKALSYSALSADRPTRPNRCVVVKEHLPASFLACSGAIWCVCRCIWSWLQMCWTRSGQGATVTESRSHSIKTPWIRCL